MVNCWSIYSCMYFPLSPPILFKSHSPAAARKGPSLALHITHARTSPLAGVFALISLILNNGDARRGSCSAKVHCGLLYIATIVRPYTVLNEPLSSLFRFFTLSHSISLDCTGMNGLLRSEYLITPDPARALFNDSVQCSHTRDSVQTRPLCPCRLFCRALSCVLLILFPALVNSGSLKGPTSQESDMETTYKKRN